MHTSYTHPDDVELSPRLTIVGHYSNKGAPFEEVPNIRGMAHGTLGDWIDHVATDDTCAGVLVCYPEPSDDGYVMVRYVMIRYMWRETISRAFRSVKLDWFYTREAADAYIATLAMDGNSW